MSILLLLLLETFTMSINPYGLCCLPVTNVPFSGKSLLETFLPHIGEAKERGAGPIIIKTFAEH